MTLSNDVPRIIAVRAWFMTVFIAVFVFYSNAVQAEVFQAGYIDGITLSVGIKPFNATQHKIKACGGGICMIDGAPFFGSDGRLPKNQINSIRFTQKGVTVSLEVGAMFEPDLHNSNIKNRISVQPYWGEYYKVTGSFSDGAGAYVAQWIVARDGALRAYIGDRESLSDLYNAFSSD